MSEDDIYVELPRESMTFYGDTEQEKKLNEMLFDMSLENDRLYEENKELEKENKKLKKQLEEYQLQNINLREDIMIQKKAFPNKKIKDKTFYNLVEMPTYEDLLNQQKEFIEYLENEIESCELTSDLIFNHNKEMKIYKEILSKYKEIIGGKDG